MIALKRNAKASPSIPALPAALPPPHIFTRGMSMMRAFMDLPNYISCFRRPRIYWLRMHATDHSINPNRRNTEEERCTSQ
ncbi:hypothetical protein WOLCODRAFT_28961 [Wolfiporia cocos MD-104 SS10]|uniref:Uncharacterized protein n=1 Tax=Wolfiporia cocos (strain MD-104) TaxID=742152 RepID=A0A2H3J673_WOLCO|nr:hypothetical protein WOLCODRAFT_28961 [Wolfiporia cocos MD-104 SS10]